MLKLLLGHWKAQRKKPSLLPEEGDIHFEEPSTINPLFEDSDSSISSSHASRKPTDLEKKEQIISKETNRDKSPVDQSNEDAPVDNELIDVSHPAKSNDIVESDRENVESASKNVDTVPESIKTIPKDVETALKDIDTVIQEAESAANKENVEESQRDEDTATNSTAANPENVKNSVISDRDLEAANTSSKDSETKNFILPPVASFLHQRKPAFSSSSKNEPKVAAEKSEDNMRIWEQPSTSAIKETKPPSRDVVNRQAVTPNPISKPTAKEPAKKQDNESKTALTKLENDKPVLSNKQSIDIEKPAKLRARAIDELIKKFQSPTADDNKLFNKVAKQEDKALSNTSTEGTKLFNDGTKKENKNPSSLALENKKENSHLSKPEKKEIFKPNKPVAQSDAANKNEVKKEALLNIFNFPPPPPLENLQNKSSLFTGKTKESKVTPPPSNKTSDIADKSKENEVGKTRSDSSLERTRTASSKKSAETTGQNYQTEASSSKIKESVLKDTIKPVADKVSYAKDLPNEQNNSVTAKTENEASQSKIFNESKSTVHPSSHVVSHKSENKVHESQTEASNDNSPVKKEVPLSSPKPEANLSNLHRTERKKAPSTPVPKKKPSLSKASPRGFLVNENDNIPYSEDSGITRGDQISSETTQDVPRGDPSGEAAAAPNPTRKGRKEKKLKSISKKTCKHCRRIHEDSVSLKRSQCDDYYDGLIGARHFHRGRHSDSMNSDLSWEEKELLRRLRSKRDTVRSNTPSTRSRHSRHRFVNEDHFRRHHHFRRSVSDESTFYGSSSLCSCDECWASYIKDYAYGRASLRGMSPIHEMCTCRTPRHNFLGRRVQFRSDPIHEGTPSERTAGTPAPPPADDEKEEDDGDGEADENRSQTPSSKTKEDDSTQKQSDASKEKKTKIPEESVRFVTPWELEEWDLFMRKHMLHKRRRRARCMGIMALAMVVFVGLVVCILMVYLRRKVI